MLKRIKRRFSWVADMLVLAPEIAGLAVDMRKKSTWDRQRKSMTSSTENLRLNRHLRKKKIPLRTIERI